MHCKVYRYIVMFKVHIFWEGRKNLRNLHLTFDCIYCSQKVKGRFRKILWPSQNILTLNVKFLGHCIWTTNRVEIPTYIEIVKVVASKILCIFQSTPPWLSFIESGSRSQTSFSVCRHTVAYRRATTCEGSQKSLWLDGGHMF